ncbi:site-specific integrase [Photobacterium profundum]|uniref:Tyr recombinase domain-containing protein n=1 Tax=Photobacterium profundum 3TCK TaxID=314280 RepID=Q1YWW7_9GAMM|nr:site-specific integrase [Photobacterium profundum]EAS40735.1 hypothetical protein P3TCK_08613 [Photobacterium profundum 3TCK]
MDEQLSLFDKVVEVVECTLTEEQRQFASNIKLERRAIIGGGKTVHCTTSVNMLESEWSIHDAGNSLRLKFKDIKNIEFSNILKNISLSFLRQNSPKYANRGLEVAKQVFATELTLDTAKQVLTQMAESEASTEDYYAFKRFVRLLMEKNVPDFDITQIENLSRLPTPDSDNFSAYYDTEIIIKAPERNMLQKGFIQASVKAKSLTFDELRDVCILAFFYTTGCRPVQAIQVLTSDLHKKANSSFYIIALPFAKKRRGEMKPYMIQLPSEIALLLNELKSRLNKLKGSKAQQIFGFETGDMKYTKFFSEAIQRQMFRFAPKDTQNAILSGDYEQPVFTPTDFRHNVGHSMAMSGATAEEIAYVLGHSNLVVARHYISATPELAMIKSRTLGRNDAYNDMIGMLLTGSIVNEERWEKKKVLGVVGGELCSGIGGCSAGVTCPYSPVRSCYGCFDFDPFSDGNHEHVLTCVNKEAQQAYDLSASTGCIKRNPVLDISEQTVFEIESVIARCKLHKEDNQ